MARPTNRSESVKPRRNPVQLREAWRGIRALIRDPDDTAQVFKIIRALAGDANERQFQRFLASEHGPRILAERRSLVDRLSDREGLLMLPEGTFGRAYAEFTAREQLSASGLVEEAARPKADQEVVQLQDARVISLKAEYDLAVLNVGRNSGVQVGMPFRIARKDRPIGHALVIDVRDHICGIIVEDLAAADDGIQLGDSAFVDTTYQSTL